MWARSSGRRRTDTEPPGKVICKERLFGDVFSCVTMKRRRRRRRVTDGRGVMNGNPRNLKSDLERKGVTATVRLDGTNDLGISQRTLSTCLELPRAYYFGVHRLGTARSLSLYVCVILCAPFSSGWACPKPKATFSFHLYANIRRHR